MTHRIEVDEAWGIGGKPHGGYLLASAVRPALDADHPHPLAVSAHFTTSAAPGPAEVEVERLRTGRRVATSRVRLLQDGELRLEALLTAGTLPTGEPVRRFDEPVDMPPYEECTRVEADQPQSFRVGHLDFVDVRAHLPTFVDHAQQHGALRAWMSWRDGRPVDAVDLLVLADSMAPVTLGLGMPGWVPTLELTVLLRALPAAGPLRARQSAKLLADGGWLDEDCDLWDSEGRLVAQARQLASFRSA